MRDRVVVTGYGVVSPIGIGVEAFASGLAAGRVGIGPVTVTMAGAQRRLMAAVVPWAEQPDLDQRRRVSVDFALRAAAEAFERAGCGAEAPGRTGLALGGCQTGPTHSIESIRAAADAAGPGAAADESRSIEIARRLIAEWSLTGPAFVVNTACAASTTAIGLGTELIRTGMADRVLCGGADELYLGAIFGLGSLTASTNGPCSPYSRSKGMSFGEGAGFLVLEREEVARARGAVAVCEVLGYGLSADAYHAVRPDPTGGGPALAVLRALNDAGIDPDQVHYVNGHGTGTASNDAMERRVLRRVFPAGCPPVSSTKSMIGHALGAGGAIEAIATMIAIERSFLPPTCSFDETAVDDEFDFVPNRAVSAPVSCALSTSYGFGGNNAALVLGHVGMGAPRRARLGLAPAVVTAAVVEPEDEVGVHWAALSPLTRDQVPEHQWERVDPLARLAVAAADRAITTSSVAERVDGDRIGILFVSRHGPTRAVDFFIDSVMRGKRSVVPWAFPNASFNAANGRIAQTYGFRGPNATFAGGGSTGLFAVLFAAALIRSNVMDAGIVVGAEDIGHPLAAAIVLEGSADGGGPQAVIGGGGVARAAEADAAAPWLEALDQACATSGIEAGRIRRCVSTVGDGATLAPADAELVRLPLAGTHGAAGIVSTAVAAALVAPAPGLQTWSEVVLPTTRPDGAVLVSGMDALGGCTSLIVARQ